MKVKKTNEVKKVGRPHPKTAVVEEAKGYERTYEGFFDWVWDTGRDVPKDALSDYCELENLRNKTGSSIVAEAIGQAQREFRVKVFNQIKEFLERGHQGQSRQGREGSRSRGPSPLPRGEGNRIQLHSTDTLLPTITPRLRALLKPYMKAVDARLSARKGCEG